jgi:hypothetical protein
MQGAPLIRGVRMSGFDDWVLRVTALGMSQGQLTRFVSGHDL